MRIDLNGDVGESFGAWSLGEDSTLIPLLSSVNVACGAHAGDPSVIERTVRLATASGVAVGAHPGYPDLAGFGRRDMTLTDAELEASVLYQVAALDGIARACGSTLRHVKPHGALYNRAAADARVARAIARAIRRLSDRLILVGPPRSALREAGDREGLQVAAEGFCDRAYEPDGSLRSRRMPDAMHTDPGRVAAQALDLARDGRVRAVDGTVLDLQVDTICIHGDTPGAAGLAGAVRTALTEAGIAIAPLSPRHP